MNRESALEITIRMRPFQLKAERRYVEDHGDDLRFECHPECGWVIEDSADTVSHTYSQGEALGIIDDVIRMMEL